MDLTEVKAVITNAHVLEWIEETAAMTQPDAVVLIDGSEEQLDALRAEAVSNGELIRLNQEKLPGCYLHRSTVNDADGMEAHTFLCSKNEEDAGPTNRWMAPEEAYAKLKGLFTGSMKGRAMYVVPYSMGPLGSPFSKIGIELTDSLYAVLSMNILTRVGRKALERLKNKNTFVRGLHAKGQLREEERFLCHFPEDNTIWSIGSDCGGGAILSQTSFGLRIASYQGKTHGWLAEHMLILGIENPKGETKYICAAFPADCGKTSLAMLVPPEIYKKQGYKVWTVGDDIAWLRVGEDGRLWAVNPENGFSGATRSVSEKANPNALATIRKDTIFTNVVQNLDDNTVWWEGLGEAPKHALDWKGEKWDAADGKPGAHPNGCYTAPAAGCPGVSPEFDTTQGVPISAVLFGGRRTGTVPLVYESFSWNHGVFMGSILGSESEADPAGAVRRDPMAMLPFCGYNMGDYWKHWVDIGLSLSDPPRLFNVNWFRTDGEGRCIWPGFGENLRVLLWILQRTEQKARAVKTAIGYEPQTEDIGLDGLELTVDTLKELLSVDAGLWKKELEDVRAFYAPFGDKLPEALAKELDDQEKRLG